MASIGTLNLILRHLTHSKKNKLNPMVLSRELFPNSMQRKDPRPIVLAEAKLNNIFCLLYFLEVVVVSISCTFIFLSW